MRGREIVPLLLIMATLCAAVIVIAMSAAGWHGFALLGLAVVAIFAGYRISRVSRSNDGSLLGNAFLNALSQPILVADGAGKLVYANSAAQTIFSCSHEPSVCLADKTELPRDFAERVVNSKLNVTDTLSGTGITRFETQDGKARAFRLHRTETSALGESLELIELHDVTDLVEKDRRIAELEAEIRCAYREIDQFTYFASHDLKAPLRVIDNASQWIEEDLEPVLSEDTRESLLMLRGRVRRMEGLLNALLEHSRVGRITSDPSWVRGEALAEEIVGRVHVPEHFRVTFDTTFLSTDMPRAPLNEILTHLVENSVRHHDGDRGQVDIVLESVTDPLEIVVRDDGPGIPEEYHQKVFEIFQTLKRRDEHESNGMGLAIVQKHVQVAGGGVRIEPGQGRGTSIRLTWPLPSQVFNEDIAV